MRTLEIAQHCVLILQVPYISLCLPCSPNTTTFSHSGIKYSLKKLLKAIGRLLTISGLEAQGWTPGFWVPNPLRPLVGIGGGS